MRPSRRRPGTEDVGWSWGDIFHWTMGLLLVGLVIAGFAIFATAMTQHSAPTRLDGELQSGDELIYAEQVPDVPSDATRIIHRGNCYLVQEWGSRTHHWYLSESSGHGFGGTDNIPAVQCVPDPVLP